jgi:hypothetical protein
MDENPSIGDTYKQGAVFQPLDNPPKDGNSSTQLQMPPTREQVLTHQVESIRHILECSYMLFSLKVSKTRRI